MEKLVYKYNKIQNRASSKQYTLRVGNIRAVNHHSVSQLHLVLTNKFNYSILSQSLKVNHTINSSFVQSYNTSIQPFIPILYIHSVRQWSGRQCSHTWGFHKLHSLRQLHSLMGLSLFIQSHICSHSWRLPSEAGQFVLSTVRAFS